MKKIISSTIVALIIPFLSPCQNWQGLGTGMNDAVRCMYSDTITNTLYAGGNFSTSGGITTLGISQWNGLSWDSLPHNFFNCPTCGIPVLDIIRYKNEIYEGGNGLGKWNGSAWGNVGGFIGSVYRFFILNNELYVGGMFSSAGGVPANSLAKWNDTVWTDVHSLPTYNTSNQINSIIIYQGEMYIGGNLGTANAIVKWDGTSWQTVAGGIYGSISDMAIYNNELYVSGAFTRANGNADNNIQKWNGTNWSSVGGGVMGTTATSWSQIAKLTVFHNKLYAIGSFYYAGGVPAISIAYWDGTNWCGLGTNSIITGVVHNDSLYVGCGILTGTDTVNHIAKWVGGNYVDSCGHINVGVNEIETSDEVNIYPNPATNEITIETKEKGIVSIYNVLVEMVIKTEEKKIDVSGLAKGIYFIKLEFENTSISKKFIKN